MAVQSSFYVPDGSTRTFPSTKHIATKQHVGVYLQRALDSVWVTALSTSYELVNNSIVFDSAVDNILYVQIEIRVVDTTAELIDSPSNISIVAASIADVNTVADSILDVNTVADNISSVQNTSAINADISTVASVSTNVTTVAGVSTSIPTVAGISANVTTVAGVSGDVTTVANSIANVNTNATNIADINSVATTVVPNIDEILLADDNATTATTQAGIATTQATNASSSATQSQLYEWEAEAERLTADSYATEAEDTFVNLVTSDGDGTFTYTPTTDYSALHWAAKAATFNPAIYAPLASPALTNPTINGIAQSGYTGFKNFIINGNFAVNQYADIDTAPVAMVNGVYQINRHISSIAGVTGTIQRLAGQTVNGKKVKTIKCIATSTNTSSGMGLYQKVEEYHNGEELVEGAWVKSNNVNARLIINDGISTTASTNHSGGGEWEFLTVPKNISASASLLYVFVSITSVGSSNVVPITTGDYIESTMWQLESGTVATPFEQRPYGLELSLCQRYAEKIAYTDGASEIAVGNFDSTSAIITQSLSVTPKRVKGTCSISAVAHFEARSNVSIALPLSSLTVVQESIDKIVLVAVISGTTTAGIVGRVRAINTGAFIFISSEL